MSRKIPKLVIGADAYQKFAKAKKKSPTELAIDGTQYQDFKYNKKNIPEDALISTKDNSKDDLEEAEGLKPEERKRPNTEGTTDDEKEPGTQEQKAVQKQKAKTLVQQIINPKNKGEQDAQLDFTGYKSQAKFYYRIAGEKIPASQGFDYFSEVDVTSKKYADNKEKDVRRYEQQLKKDKLKQDSITPEQREIAKEQNKQRQEKAISQ